MLATAYILQPCEQLYEAILSLNVDVSRLIYSEYVQQNVNMLVLSIYNVYMFTILVNCVSAC